MTTTQTPWQKALHEWIALSTELRERGRAIDESIHNRGWALAASVGIPHNVCCLHNASIDTELKGWCAGNPGMLKVAKQANYLVNRWPGSDRADKAIWSAWNRLMVPVGAPEHRFE